MQQYLKQSFIIFFIFFLVQTSPAQRFYAPADEVPVLEGGQPLSMPWAGGLNAPILQSADLSGNGREELISFDRTSQGLMVFMRNANTNAWQARPELVCLLPADISNWFIMKDYDGDGQKDIFTFTSAGIRVFRNVSPAGSEAAWELVSEFLTYQSNGREVNLLVNSSDLPGIEDVDGDGDLDVLAYDPSGGGGLEYYRNNSVETNGLAGLSPFVKESTRWGGLAECDCGEFAYNEEACKGGSGHRQLHTGGKSLLLFDVDLDGDYDLLNGFEECSELYYLENIGSNTAPMFEEFKTVLPGSAEAVDMQFPAAFALTEENLNAQALVVSSQLNSLNISNLDYGQSLWLFRQEVQDGMPLYLLSTKSFLQEEMLDAGESAIPAFLDVDSDGDLDMLLSSAGNRGQEDYGSIQLFMNTGSADAPAFELADDNFLDIGSLRLLQLQQQLIDFNKDGRQDLLLIGTETERYQRKVFLLLNAAAPGEGASFSLSERKELNTPVNVQLNPFFYDVNSDGAPDLLAGKFDGSLSLYENMGTADAPQYGGEIKNYLGVGLDNYRRPLLPSVGDLSGNGQPDLLLADGTGSIRYMRDFLQDGQIPDPEEIQFCEGAPGEAAGANWLGRKSWPVVAALRNGKAPLLAIGNLTGGLYLLETDELPAKPSEGELLLKVYPNPVAFVEEDVLVLTNMPARILLFSVTGQLLKELQVAGNVEISIPLSGLEAGLYIVQATFDAGGKLSRKLIILK